MDPVANKPILDYASPRSHGNLRLPSRSVLTWQWSDPREYNLIVRETLRGRGSAIAALIFGLFILALVGSELCTFVFFRGSMEVGRQLSICTLLAILWLSEAVVLLLVIRNTWRETILETVDGELRLAFKIWVGLSVRRYCWMPGTVTDLQVVCHDSERTGFGELQVFLENHPTVHLFSDHSQGELLHLATALRSALRLPKMHATSIGAGFPRP